jgi:hypothetical protein
MAIGPDGRIIRRRVRQFTPVNTSHPAENTGFFMGLFSALLVSALFVLIVAGIGWLGGIFFDLAWWNFKNFLTAGFLINLLIFPIFVSGVLEGLVVSNFSRYRFYAFIYGTLAMALLIGLNQLDNSSLNYWNFLWAGAYGIYSMWLATKMAR